MELHRLRVSQVSVAQPICTLILQDVYVNKRKLDIKLYFLVSANFIPVSRKSHIIKQLFLCKMRTLLNYSFYKF